MRGIPATAVTVRIKLGSRPDANGCWIWMKSRDSYGYGRIKHHGRSLGAHRVSYEAFIGEVPVGLQLDHLCRNRACVNPEHLEAVTPQENTLRGNAPAAAQARQTHCRKGHRLEGANVYVWKRMRSCRTCHKARAAERRDRRRLEIQ